MISFLSARSSIRESLSILAKRRCKNTSVSEWNLVSNRKLKLNDIISHRLSIDDAPHAYEIFKNKEDKCVKVIIHP